MKNLIVIVSFLFTSLSFSQHVSYIWAKKFGGKYFDVVRQLKTDDNNNIIMVGSYNDSVDFDPSLNEYFLRGPGYTAHEGFISKLDANGNFLWAKRLKADEHSNIYNIEIDPNGDYILSGTFFGTVDFDPGPNTHYLSTTGSTLHYEGFILKLDSDGNFIYVKHIYPGIGGIDLDELGNIYSIGSFAYTQDFDPDQGLYELTSNGEYDYFIQKYSNDGNHIWTQTIGNMGSEKGTAIMVKDGFIYTTGLFDDDCDFDTSPNYDFITCFDEEDIFIQKLDTAGNSIWARSLRGPGRKLISTIHVDNNDNVITSGSFEDSIDVNTGTGSIYKISNGNVDAFIHKLNANGDYLWSHTFGGFSGDYPAEIITNANNEIYSTGTFSGWADFDPDPLNEYMMQGPYYSEIYVYKLGADGKFHWAYHMGGADQGGDKGNTINIDKNNNVIIGGEFKGTANFNPGNGSVQLSSLTSYQDAFIQKIGQPTLNTLDPEFSNGIELYPVPCAKELNVVLNTTPSLSKKYNVLDTRGQVLHKGVLTHGTNTIDISTLNSGVYYIQLFNEDTTPLSKIFIKE